MKKGAAGKLLLRCGPYSRRGKNSDNLADTQRRRKARRWAQKEREEQSMRILLIEDDKEISEMLSNYLISFKYETTFRAVSLWHSISREGSK